tara:strand:- start:1906 stop:2319 length:414 start_codon:yes stop_codon:yes gene_type:complete
MLTKKAKKRIIILGTFFLFSLVSIFFIFKSLDKNLLYFKTPTDLLKSESFVNGKEMRIGGLVKKDSIFIKGDEINFVITDLKNEILISYKGTVPSLFLEEKGVIVDGILKDKKYFIANRILAKHDENYMPPKIKEKN